MEQRIKEFENNGFKLILLHLSRIFEQKVKTIAILTHNQFVDYLDRLFY